MTPIKRLGFFAFAMLHLMIFVLLTLNAALPWSVAFISRSIGASLLMFQFFRWLHEAIKSQ